MNSPFGAGGACMFACALGVSFILTDIPAAGAITFDFLSPAGALGTTQSYTLGGITITAAGFTSNTFLTPTALYGKTGGGDENGLGIANGPDHEISGGNLLRIQVPTGLTSLSFQMGSTTDEERWTVFGSTTPTTGYSSLLSGTDELTSHNLLSLCKTCTFFYFKETSGEDEGNILLHSLTAVSAVPLPGALPLFGSGLALIGFFGWHRKRNAAVHAA